ncbi:MAG TPA: ATP-binding cassette domain-containing protein [Acidimicrobiales bacterium]|jgi:branched-chain amino acid transport system permease protein|nr:ATP-binding cassette domain-containing protein [Acidimicrobiales bacterium]
MTTFLAFTVVGVVVGCIYALSATGLVVTYITSGIFNFAHGAVGMIAAFTYWKLAVDEGWPAILALPFILFVFAPLLGVLIDVLIMRNLHAASEEVRVIVTAALLLFLLGVGELIWDPGVPRTIPRFFEADHVRVFSVNVTYHQIIVVIAAILVAVVLRLFLFRTRIGVALRATVDAPDLAAYFGAAPGRVRMLGWAMGSSLAALAGILLAPLVTLDILLLTLLVINGFAAAIVGRLKSLPLTFAGGVALGLVESYVVGYAPGGVLSQLRPTIPVIFLYIALLIFPQSRLRVGRALSRRTTKVPTLRASLIGAALFVGAAWIAASTLSGTNLFNLGRGLVAALILLSLVLLTGYGGQISLAQWTFVGFGSFAMGKIAGGDSLFGVVAAVAFAGAVGALSALPALRLRGLYLALSTFAFAVAMTGVFFNNNNVFGQGGAQKVGRVLLHGNSGFIVLIAVVFAAAAVGVLAVRRSSFGRRLVAMSDSQVACATLGMSLTWTKLILFAASAGLAGLAGALFGGLQGSVGSANFDVLNSLVLFLLLAIWGVDSIIAVLFAGLSFAYLSVLQTHFADIRGLPFLLTGLGALGLARNPNGVVAQVTDNFERTRARWRGRSRAPAAEVETVFTPLVVGANGAGNGHHGPVPALELIDIHSGYGRIEVVHGVNLVVPPATVFALLGPNGAGKSTLLRVASDGHPAWSGCVHIAGVHVNGAAPEAIARLGVCTVPEGRSIFANLTVADNLRMMSYRRGVTEDEIEERAYASFPRLSERRTQLAGTLSGGEQQMLAMARAVATEPKLLLLDEISLGLAPRIVADLYEHVAQLKEQGIAILLVEQFVQTALSVADYAAVMTQGRIYRMGETSDVTDAVSHAYMGAVG